jgi:DNA-binding IclR family transcriptional regulator
VSVLFGIWKVGAVPVPPAARLADHELRATIELVDPRIVIGADPALTGARPQLPRGHRPVPHPEVELDRSVISPAWKAIGSGGSTERPKVIVATGPATVAEQRLGNSAVGIVEGDISVITAPLSHNAPFVSLVQTLMLGGRVVLTGRFDPEKVLATIEREGATWLYLVPTMMSRIWKLPEQMRNGYDLSSLRTAIHMAAPCPMWLKRAWVDWLGPDRLRAMYTSAESVVVFVTTGREWLERQGTVGLPRRGEVQIRYLSSMTLPEVAQPHLEHLSALVHESSSASLLDGDDVVYVARVAASRIMTVSINIGTRLPAYATSMGHVLLAGLPTDQLDSYLRRTRLEPLTVNTLTAPAALRTELEIVRAQGYSIVDQELEEGLRSVAAPVRDAAGTVIAAVNISTHASRRTLDEVRSDLVGHLRSAAAGIERDLSAAKPVVRLGSA